MSSKSISIIKSRPWRFIGLSAILVFLLGILSCQLSQDPKVENTADFDAQYETLSQYDSVVIIFKDLQGDLLDTVFQGKVDSHAKIRDLDVAGWDGGQAEILISGFNAGKLVYQVDKRFDGKTNQTDANNVLLVPDAAIQSEIHELQLAEGDSLKYPTVSVVPAVLTDKTVTWSSSDPEVLRVGPDGIKALKTGFAELRARLKSAQTVAMGIKVTVGTIGQVPETIAIAPDNLEIVVGGVAESLVAQVSPTSASGSVTWSSEDSLLVVVDSVGHVTGLRKGETRIWATSKVRPNVRGSASIRVTGSSGSIPVERINFPKDTLEVIAGSAPESLIVSVSPPGAVPAVTFSLSDPSKVTIQKGKVAASASGTFTIIAMSVSNPSAKDTLCLKVLAPGLNDTIPPVKPVVRVTPAGPTRERRPVWTWATGSGGAGRFQLKLDSPDFTSGAISTTDTSFHPSSDLEPGTRILFVRERDSAGNWSQAGSAQVEIDTVGPAAPKVYGSSQTSVLPRWTWSTGGGAGAGFFRFRLGDANFPAGASESRDTTYAVSSAVSGTTYSLYVQERDAAGNWSAAGTFAIKYDLTKPTVSIQSPQASGIFITPLDTLKISGTCGGPNAIAKLEFSLDGGPVASIVSGAAGDWITPSLKLTDGKTVVIKVVATDNLGNTGEAQLSVLRDSDPPTPPGSLSAPASPTSINLASWIWAPGGDGPAGSGLNGHYRWKTNSGNWTETTSASAVGVALSEGANVFSVQEQDKALNWSSSAMDTVVLDTKAPDPVVFSGTNNGFTSNRQPTWSWTPSSTNGGVASYSATLEGPDGSKDTVLTATSYKPPAALTDGTYKLTVRQRDQVAGIFGTAASFTVNVDGTLPVIVVTGKANGSTSNLNNANTATLTGSITDDGSSLAAATWELSGGTTKTTVAIASPGSFSIAVPAMSNHATTTVTLKAADKAGNASTYAIKFAIEVAAPTVQWLSGSTEDGFVTSSDKVTVQYSINGGSTISETINMAAPSQPDQYTTTTKTISATNAIAETVSDTRTFYRVHASVRFFSPTGKPFLDCMSWKNACSFGGSTVPGMENMTLWMTEGTYRITSDFSLPQGSALKGQLKTTSKTSSERSSLPTILASSRHSLFVTNTRLEYLTFTFDTTGADGSSKYFLEAGAINNNGTENPWVILDHCKFEGITGGTLGVGAAIHGANTLLSLTVNETTFNNIDAGEGSGGVYIYGSQNTLTFTKCTFSGRRPVIDVNLSEGKVIFDTCTPLKPKTFQELTCVGNVCSSN